MSRLFVSDLDGTLLDGSARLSARTRGELVDLLASGMQFTVASARSVHTIAEILGDLPISLPIIEFNGAFITDLHTRHSLVCHALEPGIAEAVMRWGLAAGVCPFVSAYTRGEQALYPPVQLTNAAMAHYLDGRMRARDRRLRAPIDCFTTLDQPITCLTLIAHIAVLAPLQLQIDGAFPGLCNALTYVDRSLPGWHWLTVQSVHATKERALREVAEQYGHALDVVTVFGDEINDVSMFRCAGRAVAVENAIDELKAIAHEVIGPHHEDSVVQYLRRMH
jgi:Cof subfamily protein (haloacid dehalogenase superfamily)